MRSIRLHAAGFSITTMPSVYGDILTLLKLTPQQPQKTCRLIVKIESDRTNTFAKGLPGRTFSYWPMFGRNRHHHTRADDSAGFPRLSLCGPSCYHGLPCRKKTSRGLCVIRLLVLTRSPAATSSAHGVVANATCDFPVAAVSWLASLRQASWTTGDSRRRDEDFSSDHGRIRRASSASQLSKRSVPVLVLKTSFRKDRWVSFSARGPLAGSVFCMHVRRLEQRSRVLFGEAKGADDYSL